MTIKKTKPAATDNASLNSEHVTSQIPPNADTGDGSKAIARRPRRMAREPKAGMEAGAMPAIVSSSEGIETPASTAAPAEPRQTKSAAVLALLQRKEGATLDQLVEATGWLPHTARAALTGLRKKGHVITSSKQEGQPRVYRAEQA